MKIWMADVLNAEDDTRETAVLFAPHETRAKEMIADKADECVVQDIFEIKLDDNRWDELLIVGKLKSPERF